MRILVVDNYDSFVFNLVQYLGQLGESTTVWRNDDDRLADPASVAREFDANTRPAASASKIASYACSKRNR